MNRRQFIHSAGCSLGALILVDPLRRIPRTNQARTIMIPPDHIEVLTDQRNVLLTGSGGMNWNAGAIEVLLSAQENGLAIDVRSPEEGLKFVTMIWNLPRKSSSRCLGDQWERSYGDLEWKSVDAQRIMPWYFMEYDDKVTNGFGVRTGGSSLCFWQAGTENLRLTLDLRSGGNGVVLGERMLRAAEIVTHKGNESDSPFEATRKFCAKMCSAPRLPKEPVYGINDWYFTYGNNSADLILEHASLMTGLAAQNTNKPFCVIDAGWALEAPGISRNCWADTFAVPNHYFGDMAKLASKIRDLGMRPGLWVRPLCGSMKDDRSRLMPAIPRQDSPNAPFLDPTIPENMERIRNYFILYRQWGYELIKHDFTTADLLGKWGFRMIESRDVTFANWHFNDTSKTNAEIIVDLYRAIREASSDTYLIGCNTISHLSAGLFELQRIGDDTSGREWERTRRMGVNTLGFRLPQHKTFYAADGDCVGLTPNVTWEKNRQWMQLVAETGTPLFISGQKEAIGEAQREFIRRSFATASRPVPDAEPLDWMETKIPSRWRLMDREVVFDWS